MEVISNIRGKTTRLILVALLLGIVGASLAACGGDEATATPTAGPGAGNATVTPSSSSGTASEVAATLNEWSIALNVDQVDAGPVKFTVTNEGKFGHDLSVLDSSNNQVGAVPVFNQADGAKELTVDLKPGTYTIVCDVPGHTAQGMKTTLVVK